MCALVTGVQTCALPISCPLPPFRGAARGGGRILFRSPARRDRCESGWPWHPYGHGGQTALPCPDKKKRGRFPMRRLELIPLHVTAACCHSTASDQEAPKVTTAPAPTPGQRKTPQKI